MNEKIESTIVAEKEDVTQKDLLRFAKWVLAVVTILFVLGCMTELMYKGNMVFEICKTILPSITTLILGYYFGKD